jgi:CheY-like chemotaxis protein
MDLNGSSVLVVEDDPALRNLAQIALRNFGYQVTECRDGVEALSLCHDLGRRFDVILMDVKMPGMDGCEVTRRLRAHPETRYIPIVMLSGLAMASDREAGMKAGADAYVTKPYSFQELLAILARFQSKEAVDVPQ